LHFFSSRNPWHNRSGATKVSEVFLAKRWVSQMIRDDLGLRTDI